jgi:hypothetical protein
MDIIEYAKRLTKLNWNYGNLPLNEWKAAHKDYEYMARLSFTNHEFRRCWIQAKNKYGNKNKEI